MSESGSFKAKAIRNDHPIGEFESILSVDHNEGRPRDDFKWGSGQDPNETVAKGAKFKDC